MDVVEVKVDRSFPAIVLALVSEIAKMKATASLENLEMDALVKEWESEN